MIIHLRQRAASRRPAIALIMIRKPRTNVTTMKSLGKILGFEDDDDDDDAFFSSTHAKDARAVESRVLVFSPLPCNMNSTTMGSEELPALERLDRAYTFVSRPATFSVSFITSPISLCFLQCGLVCNLEELVLWHDTYSDSDSDPDPAVFGVGTTSTRHMKETHYLLLINKSQ